MIHLPNCLLVGAAKSGTSSIAYYLSQHPQISFLHNQEIHYFSTYWNNKSPHWYKTHFKDTHTPIIGETSTSYFHHPEVPARILKELGDSVKIIISLRNPVDRAYSDYLMGYNNAVETRSFSEAIKVNKQQWDQFQKSKMSYSDFDWEREYLQVGHYYEHTARYIEAFGPGNVKLIKFDNLINQTVDQLNAIFRFLGVKEKSTLDTTPHNTYTSQFRFVKKWLGYQNFKRIKFWLPSGFRQILKKWWVTKKDTKPPIDPEVKAFLKKYYRPDLKKLENLVDFDISDWQD